jgi:hypothetical protein
VGKHPPLGGEGWAKSQKMHRCAERGLEHNNKKKGSTHHEEHGEHGAAGCKESHHGRVYAALVVGRALLVVVLRGQAPRHSWRHDGRPLARGVITPHRET